MKKIILIYLIIVSFLINTVFAQTETSSIEDQLGQLLESSQSLQKELRNKKDRESHRLARKLKLITRKIISAVNSVPPTKCLSRLKPAMKDFFELVSDLGSGIACGPPIIPPFLRINKLSLNPDCLPPDLAPDQLDLNFSETLGLYDKARDIFHIDTNTNEIPDACEGKIN